MSTLAAMSQRAPDPYCSCRRCRASRRSDDVAGGEPMPAACTSRMFGVDGGEDPRPPPLSGAGGDRNYVVTVYDPDAPTVSGFGMAGVQHSADVTEFRRRGRDPTVPECPPAACSSQRRRATATSVLLPAGPRPAPLHHHGACPAGRAPRCLRRRPGGLLMFNLLQATPRPGIDPPPSSAELRPPARRPPGFRSRRRQVA